MGRKSDYKDGYRAGFNAGYDDAFYNRPPRCSEIYRPFDEYRARGSAEGYDGLYVERHWSGTDVGYDGNCASPHPLRMRGCPVEAR